MKFPFFKSSHEKNEIQIQILDVLKRESLLEPRIDDHLVFLRKNFAEFEDSSELILNQLQDLVTRDPNFIREIVSSFFVENMGTFVGLYDLARDSKKNSEGPFDKMKILAKLYEVTHLYKLAAYLFSKQNDPYGGFSVENKDKVYKYLKGLGISKQDSNNLRLIRNSVNHLPKLQEGEVLFESGEKMTIQEVDDLYLKMNTLFSWWATILGTSLYFMPKFGIIVLFTGVKEVQKNKSPDNFTNTMSLFFPDYKVQQDKRKEKKYKRKAERRTFKYRFKNKIRTLKWKILTKYYTVLGKNKFIFDRFYRDNFDEISQHLIRHSSEIADEFFRLASGSKEENVKNQYQVTGEWFAKGRPVFENLLQRYRTEGLQFFIKKIENVKK